MADCGGRSRTQLIHVCRTWRGKSGCLVWSMRERVGVVQGGDQVPLRLHWPRGADLRINGMLYHAYGRNGATKLGNNGRDAPADVGMPCACRSVHSASASRRCRSPSHRPRFRWAAARLRICLASSPGYGTGCIPAACSLMGRGFRRHDVLPGPQPRVSSRHRRAYFHCCSAAGTPADLAAGALLSTIMAERKHR